MNRSVEPAAHPPRKWRWPKVAILGLLAYIVGTDALATLREYSDYTPKPPLYGIWEVTSPNESWARLGFDSFDRLAIQDRTGKVRRATATLDAAKGTLQIQDGEQVLSFAYKLDGSRLLLAGADQSVTLQATDLRKQPLLSRGFRWISEKPFNR